MFAYNCLRLLGQLGRTGTLAPVRLPAKRRRLKTVLQEIMYRAAGYIVHARRRGGSWTLAARCPSGAGVHRPAAALVRPAT